MLVLIVTSSNAPVTPRSWFAVYPAPPAAASPPTIATGQPHSPTGSAIVITKQRTARNFDIAGPPTDISPHSLCDKKAGRFQCRRGAHGQGLEVALAASLIHPPGAGPMPGHPERRHQHKVESRLEPGEIGAREQEGLCGAGDSPPLPGRQRRCRRVELVSRLDLDNREHAAATRQDVDLARGATPTLGEDAPAPQPQMPQAQPFGEPPAALRPLPPMRGCLPRRSHSSASRIAKARRYSSPRGIPVSAASFAAASRTPSSASAVRSRSSTSAWSGSSCSGGPTTTTASPRGGPARR